MMPARLSALVAVAALAVACLLIPTTSAAFQAGVTDSTATASAATRFSCTEGFASAALRSAAYLEYSLGGTGGTEPDLSTAGNTGTYTANHSTVAAGSTDPCSRDTASAPFAWHLDGASDWLSTSQQFQPPGDFTLMVSFRTPTVTGTSRPMYLFGYAGYQSGVNGQQKDRHLYVDVNGYLQFGVYNGGTQMANTTGNSYDGNVPASGSGSGVKVTDGQWHTVVAVSGTRGLSLWLDGTLMGTTPKVSGDFYAGWWRIGAGDLNGWPNTGNGIPGNYFPGDVRFAAAFSTTLTEAQIRALWLDAGATKS